MSGGTKIPQFDKVSWWAQAFSGRQNMFARCAIRATDAQCFSQVLLVNSSMFELLIVSMEPAVRNAAK